MKHFLMILLLGLISLENLYTQDLKKINYQIDFGTNLTIPYKTKEVWPDLYAYPQTDYDSDFGYFFEALVFIQ